MVILYRSSLSITKPVPKMKGFTLVELIITIIIIGVLAVSAASRFQDRSSFDTFALQGQIVSSLRHMQFRAMQDTRANYCHQIVFDSVSPAVGPPSNDYSASIAAAAATCSDTIGVNTPDFLRIDSSNFNELGATLSASDGNASIRFINFNSLGQPLTAVSNCANDCRITVSAQSSASVCVNSEGFIRGC